MKKFIAIAILLLSLSEVIGNITYSKKFGDDAVAVIKNYREEFKIFSPSEAQRTIKYDITIMNEAGEKYGMFYEYYDQFRSINIKNATIYNARGEKIKKIRRRHFKDESMVPGYSLYDDNRLIYYKPHVKSYPYTVSYEYEIDYEGLLSYPSWTPHFDYGVAVRTTQFKLIVPKTVGIHYREHHLPSKAKINDKNNKRVYIWKADHLKPLYKEPLSPPVNHDIPRLDIAPNRFEIDGFRGRLDTWKNFGKWNNKLLRHRDSLLPSTVREIQRITDTLDQTKEKVKHLFEYVRSKTRYVSIQLGIGGWQPSGSLEVDKLGYGDCKALANYTKSILETAGIKSHYALIKSSTNPFIFDWDFPSNQFNHAILCVPNNGDTLWLETTSKTKPLGYLGRRCSNRKALLITPEGGKIANTPHFCADDNLQLQSAEINLSCEGNAIAQINTTYNGLWYDEFLAQKNKSSKKKENWLSKHLPLNEFNIEAYDYQNKERKAISGTRQLKLKIQNYAAKSGKRLFLPLNLLGKRTQTFKEIKKRHSKVMIKFSCKVKDTIKYDIPNGYAIEYLPERKHHESVFGEYTAKTTSRDKKIHYIREIKLKKGIYPSNHYRELCNFFRNIVKADRKKAVLVRQNKN